MNMTKISLDQFCAIFSDLINVETMEMGPGIAHRGEHPTEGETFLIQCDSHGLMISEGAEHDDSLIDAEQDHNELIEAGYLS